MSLNDAVARVGPIPDDAAQRKEKKRYSELLSKYLAEEIADGLRRFGLTSARPLRNEPGERDFQGGISSKRVDVFVSDERSGLLLAVSVKTICFAPFSKNLKNRYGDLVTEVMNLHLRFPYAVVSGFFALPVGADQVAEDRPGQSTFRRALELFRTVNGRSGPTGSPENFESFHMMLFQPMAQPYEAQCLSIVDSANGSEVSEDRYFQSLVELFERRNPYLLR